MGERFVKVSEKIKFSPDPNRIKSLIRIPCIHNTRSWIVEVVEWTDGACVFFCDVEGQATTPPFCVESESLNSGFEEGS